MFIFDRFKECCYRKGVKIAYIENAIGVYHGYFNNVRSGKNTIPEWKIHQVAKLLDTSYAYLTGESSNPSRKDDRYPQFDYDRYNERRIARHLTPDYSEAQLHLPEDYWEDVRDGYVIPDEQTVTKLAVLLNTTYDYLMGLTDNPEIPDDDRTGVKIRLFGEVAAGIPITQIDNFDPEDTNSWEEIARPTAKGGTYFALRIKGDSMEPRIMNGDRVIVRYQESVESGQTAVVAINGDTATCKRVFFDERGVMSLVSNNPKYPPSHFTAEEIQKLPVRILGKVVEIRGEP